jgi:signal transduction histidine kinase
MASVKTQFSRKLHIAFGLFLLITLTLDLYFFYSVRVYQYDLGRIAKANEVLQAYQVLDHQVLVKLQSMSAIVLRGNGQVGGASGEVLRQTIEQVRKGINEEIGYVEGGNEELELVALQEIERTVDNIVSTAEAIDAAMLLGDPAAARATLNQMHNDALPDRFDRLLEQAIEEQFGEARRSHIEALGITGSFIKWLPLGVTVLVVLTGVLMTLFSRSLTRSLRLLHEAVDEYTGGNLKHRIPDIADREFTDLGKSFNTMARELHDSRLRLHDNNARLEAMVGERTRALQDSNQKLADVDETRRKLLADISHEFRTPLTVIRGESEIALRGSNKSESEYREALQRIISQADHTTRLVDDLLFIARADAGESRLDMKPVAVGNLVGEICKGFQASAQAKAVRIRFEDSGSKGIVRGDTGRLRQVFTILLDNALRYSHPGGHIEVSVNTVQRKVNVHVRDQGIGLTEAEAAKAFERFFRGAQAAGHARGTGLGLPVAKAIVEAHGGSIGLTGKPGEGAEASVILPVEDSMRVVS